MRLGLLALVCLLASGAAAAPPPSASAADAPAEGLRGSVPAASPKPAPTPLDSRLPTASFAGASLLGQTDASQCREGCARTYYFCLATEGATSCPENWSQCLSGCARGPSPLPSRGE